MKSILKHFVFTLGLLLLFAQTICAQNLIQMRPQWTKECISLTTNWTILCRIKEVSVTKKTYYDTIYYDTSSVTLDSSGHWVWALIKSPVDGGREDEVDIFVLTDNGKFASLGQNDNHRQCYRFLDEVVMSGQLDNQPVNFVYKTSYDTDEPSPMEEDPIALKCLWNMVFKKHIKSQNPEHFNRGDIDKIPNVSETGPQSDKITGKLNADSIPIIQPQWTKECLPIAKIKWIPLCPECKDYISHKGSKDVYYDSSSITWDINGRWVWVISRSPGAGEVTLYLFANTHTFYTLSTGTSADGSCLNFIQDNVPGLYEIPSGSAIEALWDVFFKSHANKRKH